MDLTQIRKALIDTLDGKYKSREQGLPLCRSVVRMSANTIRAVHRRDKQQADQLLAEAGKSLKAADEAMCAHPDIRHGGYYHDAAKEFAEAKITYALVFDLPFPTPDDIGVEPAAYLNGMGEAIGEMRRHLLDLMRDGHLERSEGLLGAMDEMYYLLISMDYPDAMTGGLRRTTDVARSIIERTRGDLSTTIIQHGLKSALEEARRNLDQG